MTGGGTGDLGGDLSKGYYVKPTVSWDTTMRVSRKRSLAQFVSVTKFKDLDDAIQIGNDTV